uniref:Chromo domain-containing protein n=1 Tax=Glossina brevipalpis TaxID=37001 RepID=A0A1A9VZT7_9MUSC
MKPEEIEVQVGDEESKEILDRQYSNKKGAKRKISNPRLEEPNNKRIKEREVEVSSSESQNFYIDNSDSDCESLYTASSTHFKPTGFDKGLQAENILGYSDANGTLYFIVQYKGEDEVEFVPSSVTFNYVPQLIDKYFEKTAS